ncbi:hypothetical protein DL96DRAFT_1556053 [Flagelloscypha sp. PMI_526]|nr:hypothetical protein DL96DRAFT_1556053 [Flagelloscypha sp. PMI_526]
MLQSLKKRGNTHFKAGQFEHTSSNLAWLWRAIKFYQQAESLSPSDPIFPSNLSAAFFEKGDYVASSQAILRSASRTPDENAALKLKLSQRLAKCLNYGTLARTIPFSDIEGAEMKNIVRNLRSFAEESGNHDARNAWDGLSMTLEDIKGRDILADFDMSRRNLAELPVFRSPLVTLGDYHCIGTDNIISIVDDWADDEQVPMPLSSLTSAQRASLAFIFGGVGDADMLLGQSLDCGTTRDLVILLLIDDLLQRRHKDDTEVQEIQATIMFSYVAPLLPGPCLTASVPLPTESKIFFVVLTSDHLPWLFIVPTGIDQIIDSIDYWLERCEGKTVRGVLENHNTDVEQEIWQDVMGSNSVSGFAQDLKARQDDKLQEILSQLDSRMSEEQIIEIAANGMGSACPPSSKAKARAVWMKKAKQMMASMMLDMENKSGPTGEGMMSYHIETQWYEHLKAVNEIKDTWKPNLALFDKKYDTGRDTGYPNLHMDIFQKRTSQSNGNNKLLSHDYIDLLGHNPAQRDNKLLSNSSRNSDSFFDTLVEALKGMENKITVEVTHGDLCQEVVKMKLGADLLRPKNFPRKYMRMWLSNVPDYTHGPSSTAVYIVPNLELSPYAEVASNCMLNTGIWHETTGDFYCHNYTLLLARDIPRYLGCGVKHMKPMFGLITLTQPSKPLPLLLSDLATRTELNFWLHRLMIYAMIPPAPQLESVRVVYPNNLVAVFNIIVHLQTIGYPLHWLSEFLTDILLDRCYSSAVPYTGRLPVPLSEASASKAQRKLHLDPWKVDWELILSESRNALVFPPTFPLNPSPTSLTLCTPNEFANYRVQNVSWSIGSSMFMWFNEDPNLSLLFMSPGLSIGAERIVKNMVNILEGEFVSRKNEIYVQSVIQTCDMEGRVLQWRMKKERVEMMKRASWTMVPIRFDVREAGKAF